MSNLASNPAWRAERDASFPAPPAADDDPVFRYALEVRNPAAGTIAQPMMSRRAAIDGPSRQPAVEAVSDPDPRYWVRQLAGLPRFEMPADYPRGAAAYRAARLVRPLPDAVAEALGARPNSRATCLPAAVVACLAVVLHRYTGETDICIGIPAGGRAGMLPLRLDLTGDPAFADLATHVDDVAREASRHPPTTLGDLIGLLHPGSDPARNPLFSVTFGGTLEPAGAGIPPEFAELAFAVAETAGGWQAGCTYDAALFAPATVSTLLAALEAVCTAAAADPASEIQSLPLLDAVQRAAVIAHDNATLAAIPEGVALPALLAERAAHAPDQIAVVAGAASLTYRQLDAASNRLARYLHARGIGAGALVGVCLDRSIDMVVALLGVMKSGAAYVPLDPSYPPRRLEQVIEDADLAAILTATGTAAALPAGTVECILLDRLEREIARHSRHRLELSHGADDLAYVIFTSGSTGRPKGVRIRNRGLVNLLCGMAHSPGMTAQDVLVAVTTIAFDIAALELFLPLLVGARLVIADRDTASDGAALARLLDASGATVLQATPATWQLLLEAGWRGSPTLKMLCGGEALSRRLADRLLATGGELWNMYGPTETTIWSSAWRVSPGRGAVPIGPPMANTTFHVLDATHAPVPNGAIGELFIGGAGVADGYLDRPELTAERFLPDPFCPGRQLYRTGDLARRHPDGGLTFLGRSDQQVKLRGFRIELGEIETVLRDEPDVSDAAAKIWHRDPGGDESLAVYVAVRREVPDLAARLRARIAQALPPYMHPSSITILDALPRTPNGKLDRAALPAPDDRAATRQKPAIPTDTTETRLAAIWCATLGLEAVDADDNFFELGGHSLLAARMLTCVEAAFDRRLPLSLLFRAPSLREFAAIVRGDSAPKFNYQLVEVQKSAVGTPVFAINHTWLYHPLARQLGADRPFYATQVFEPEGPRSIAETAALHVKIVRHVRPHGPYILLGLCSAASLAYEVAQQLAADGETVPLVVLIDAWAPDYVARLPRRQALLADWSYRAQMFRYDLRREVSHSIGDTLRFCGRRLRTFAVKHSIGMFRRSPATIGDPVAALDAAADKYRPKQLASRMLVFYREDMPSGRFLDPHLGWDVHAGAGLHVVALPGDHFDMFRRPGVDLMAAEIRRALEP